VLVSDEDESLALLDAGEATYLPVGTTGTSTPTFDGAVAPGHLIALVDGSDPTAFVPGEGHRDVNLVRDVLAPGESLTVVSPFPIFVVVASGELVDVGGGSTLLEGDAVTLGTTVELRNDRDQPAIVLAAAVGGQVP